MEPVDDSIEAGRFPYRELVSSRIDSHALALVLAGAVCVFAAYLLYKHSKC